MKIYYDLISKRWGHKEEKRIFTWGHQLSPIPSFSSTSKNIISFHVKKKGQKVGPLIGILAGTSRKKGFSGNRSMFKRIQIELARDGGIAIIVPIDGLNENGVEGFIFTGKKWIRVSAPYPDCFYNRIPTRMDESSKYYDHVIKKVREKAIPLFNPHFFSKWNTILCLLTEPTLSKHIPKTSLFENKDKVQEFLIQIGKIFIKPDEGRKGNGIYLLEHMDQSLYLLKSQSSQHYYKTFTEAWDYLIKKCKKKYIVQEAIPLAKYHDRPFDIRVLVHRKKDGWEVSGIGLRCSGKNGITTHVPKGGKILSIDQVNQEINVTTIEDIASKTGNVIHSYFGHVGEFSMDIALSENGNYYILEINSKPMSFDEPDIQKTGLENLIQYLYYITDFNG